MPVEKTTVRLILLCFFYICYLFLGAAVFSALEYSNEKSEIETLKLKRQSFLQKHTKCLNGKKHKHIKYALNN
jgi:hypothetical protein